jgi:hypothetical protein
MTATREGLQDLVSLQGYAHHIISDLQQSAKSKCAFCTSIFRILSCGQLFTPDPSEQRVRVGFDKMVRTSIRAYCNEEPRYGKYHFSDAPVLMLTHVVVEFIFEGRKCHFQVPAPDMQFYTSKRLLFKAFTDTSNPFYVRLIELAGGYLEMIG